MAKAKKKEELTLDEKLERALVPIEEQLYQVPENWYWVRLGVLGYTNIGLTYKPSDVCLNGTIVLRSSNIQNGHIDYKDIVMIDMEIPDSKMCKKGDILICARNGSKALVGKTAIVDRNDVSYGAFMAIFRSQFNPFIYYFLNSHYFRNLIDSDVNTTTINQVTQSLIKELSFPLPPLAEQKRIVERIESLFVKLNEAKEKVLEVIKDLEIQKQMVLQAGFEGKLTRRWRDDRGIAYDSWKQCFLKDVCLQMKAGGDKPNDFVELLDKEHLIPVVANGITNEGIIGYTSEAKYKAGAVTVSGRGTIGFSVNREYDFYPVVRLIVLCPKTEMINSLFLKYIFDAYPEEGTGSSIPQLTVPSIKEKNIPLPSLEEQEEIVSIIKKAIEKYDASIELSKNVIERIDLMKKSILAKAFRGELGTNNPDEESAIELLKEILGKS